MGLVLASCGSVAIKEEDFYTDATPSGAIVTHFYSTDSSRMGQAAWDSVREGMTCMQPQAFADVKAAIEKLCTKVSCTQASVVALRAFLDRISP